MWRTTVKGLVAHKLRLSLTTLAIVLGVGFVAGTFVLTDTMRAVFDDLFEGTVGGVDVYVRAESGYAHTAGGAGDRERVPEALLDTVTAVDGVAVAAGAADGFATFVDKDGQAIVPVGPPTLGFSWVDPPLTPLTLRAGRAPERAGEVAMDAVTARTHDFATGDRVTVLLLGGPEEFEVVGIVGLGEADNLAGATVAVFELRTAQRVFGLEGSFSSIEVAAAEGVSAGELRERIAAALPAGFEAVTGADIAAETADAIAEGLGFFTTALLVFAAVALFVGAFIIANTFAIIVAQRAREFALLRALGASTGQVTRSVLLEATIVALVASAIGIVAGLGLGRGLYNLMGAFGLSLPEGDLVLRGRTIVVGMTVGLVVTLVSALVPARRAARVEPVAAMRQVDAPAQTASGRRVAGGALLSLAGGALLVAGLAGATDNPPLLVGIAALVVFLGIAMLSPVVAGPLARVIGAPGARLGVPGRLARSNARRSPKRTAATASALMIGLALVTFVAILAASLKASLAVVLEETMRADFVIESAQRQSLIGFSPQLTGEVAALPEVDVISAMRFAQWRDNGRSAFLIAVDPATVGLVTDIAAVDGDLAALEEGGVFVTTSVAERDGLTVGDTVTMTFARTGEAEMTVVGTFTESPALGASHLVSYATHAQHFTDTFDHFAFVRVAEGVSIGDARAAIEPLAARYPNVVFYDQAQFRAEREGELDQLLGLVSVLLLLAILIALLGITNTLALAVFERTRELGLLRAVGMTRRQTRSMVRWESMIVAVLGAVLGMAVGVAFAWAAVNALERQGLGEFAVPAGQLGAYLVAAALAGVVAGVLPARRAARLDVLEAITTE